MTTTTRKSRKEIKQKEGKNDNKEVKEEEEGKEEESQTLDVEHEISIEAPLWRAVFICSRFWFTQNHTANQNAKK